MYYRGSISLLPIMAPSKIFRESFAITDDDIQKSVKSSFGEAFYDVLVSDRTIKIASKIPIVLMKTVTDEVNCILSNSM